MAPDNLRAFLIILDGVGVGNAPDAFIYGDEGSNTLGNLSQVIGGFDLPNLQRLGLGNIVELVGTPPVESPLAAYGRMQERSAGKDSVTGHWEIAGLITNEAFPVFPDGFECLYADG